MNTNSPIQPWTQEEHDKRNRDLAETAAAVERERVALNLARSAEFDRRRPLGLLLQQRVEIIENLAAAEKRRPALLERAEEMRAKAYGCILNGSEGFWQWASATPARAFAKEELEYCDELIPLKKSALADIEARSWALAKELNLVDEMLPADMRGIIEPSAPTPAPKQQSPRVPSDASDLSFNDTVAEGERLKRAEAMRGGRGR